MARLVAVYHDDETRLGDREIPLEVDDALSMVLRFENPCSFCEKASSSSPKGFQRFSQRFQRLSSPEMQSALTVEGKEVFQNLAQMFPCVGCRRSVERMFNEMKDYKHNALHPLFINENDKLTVAREHTFNPKMIYSLFYVHGSKCNEILDAIPKSKKNKRCLIHSLETQKPRTSTGNWMDIWEALSQECREELVRLEQDGLVDTVEAYLRKHRFCAECKSKVMRAYHLLVGEEDCSKEKGYCPAVYEGLRSCSGDSAVDRHVHVHCDTHYIATLISRAEPELAGGNRRERHAKTIDIAQEEILTCVGVFLYERLVKVWQRLRAEEQTWQILFFLGVETLKKNLEIALECSEGISQFELVCEEFEEEERVKLQKKVQKRQKKKQRQATKTKVEEVAPTVEETEEKPADVLKEETLEVKNEENHCPSSSTTESSSAKEPRPGCSACRHTLTDENQQLLQPCPNCKKMLTSNNNVSCKQNNELEKKRLNDWREETTGRSLNSNPESWSPRPVLVTSSSSSVSSSSSSLSSASLGIMSSYLMSPSCRDNGYFSGHESTCGTPCSSNEGSRTEDHCGDLFVGFCASCDDSPQLTSGANGVGSDFADHHHHRQHVCNPKMPLKVKNSNNQDGITGTHGLCTCKNHSGSPTLRLSNSPVLLEEDSLCSIHNNNNNDNNINDGGGPCGLTFAESDSPTLSLTGLSLEEMLERADETAAADDHDHSDGDRRRSPLEFGISAEDIDFFRSNKHRLQQQRQELRTKLKTQFLDMQRRLGCASPSCVTCCDGTGNLCGRGGGGDGDGSCGIENLERDPSVAAAETEKKKVTGMRA